MKRVFFILLLVSSIAFGTQTPKDSQHIETAASVVLRAHHFAPPTFIKDHEQALCAVASRPESASAVQTACVKVSPENRVRVQLTGYQYVGSDWAVLGRLFQRGLEQEAAQMQREIQQELEKP